MNITVALWAEVGSILYMRPNGNVAMVESLVFSNRATVHMKFCVSSRVDARLNFIEQLRENARKNHTKKQKLTNLEVRLM